MCSGFFFNLNNQTNKISYRRLYSFTKTSCPIIEKSLWLNFFYARTTAKLAYTTSENLNKKLNTRGTITKKTINKQNKESNLHNKTGESSIDAELLTNLHVFCLISIKITKNNTHATISNLFGKKKTKWCFSAGQLKLPGGRRKTRLSQKLVFKSCLEKCIGFGYKYAVIHCSGTRGSKVRIYRSFGESIKVLIIKDTTGIAHNGCRPPKVRRVN
uniref:ribosomal protein S11 n=1 Tax=Gayralia brasiliensis TaxID=1286870 RepID=UPI00241171D7|nr:ribosomal protein S11 [Gayralia brasiliensis]YP_010733827.1 ribosomal protein S11 [Monostroma nitidum]WEG93069.1 ribosomal protein S11 [Gayralia brasiliensis]WEG93098.1 ribosomal protein S11 [Monostroma nitidum]